MRGGLPDWFKVSDEQIALFRRWCYLVFAASFLGQIIHDAIVFGSARDGGLGATAVFFVVSVVMFEIGMFASIIIPTVRLRLFWTLPVITLSVVLIGHILTKAYGLDWGAIASSLVIALAAITAYAIALVRSSEATSMRKYKNLVFMSHQSPN